MILNKYPLLTATKLNNDTDSSFSLQIFCEETNTGFELNGPISLFVTKCDGKQSVAEIINEIEDSYSVQLNNLINEIEASLIQLEKDQIIKLLESKN